MCYPLILDKREVQVPLDINFVESTQKTMSVQKILSDCKKNLCGKISFFKNKPLLIHYTLRYL